MSTEPPEIGPPAIHSPAWPSESFAARLRRTARLTTKELRETLSDRRTLITLVLMPLLLYPVLTIGLRQYFFASVTAEVQREYRYGFEREDQARWFWRYLQLPPAPASAAEFALPGMPAPLLHTFLVHNVEQAVASGEVHVGIRLRNLPDPPWRPDQPLAVEGEFFYSPDSLFAREALALAERRLATANAEFLAGLLQALEIPQPPQPVAFEHKVVRPEVSQTASSLGMVIPLVLLLMTITGAVYPAIDLTAGERERGTLEILVAAPVPRLSLLVAKYLAVLAVAALTAGVNLTAMLVTLWASGLWRVIVGPGGISPQLVVQIFALMLLFAAFFSAVLLSITSFARSFKEAQAYLVPLMLVALTPGMLTLLPGLELEGLLTIAPLINITLLGRDLLTRAVEPGAALAVILSTAVYALIAIAVAARVFGAEAVLYASHAGWSDWLARPHDRRPAATAASAVLCLVILFPVYFFVTGAISMMDSWSMAARLTTAGLATGVLFAGIPLVVAAWKRVSWREGLALRAPRPFAVLGALLLGVSLWPVAHEIVVLLQELGVATYGAEQFERVRAMLGQWRAMHPLLIVLALGIVPGVCEELFFRGFLLRAFVESLGRWWAWGLSSLAFGVFHLLTTDGLAFERLAASTFLGLALGGVCLVAGSVLPSMLLHAVHNSLLLLLAYFQPQLAARGWGVEEAAHLPARWLALALVGIALGATLVYAGRCRRAS